MNKIVREDVKIHVSETTGADVPAPIEQNINLLQGTVRSTNYEKDGNKEHSLLTMSIVTQPIVCQTALSTHPCVSSRVTYEVSKTCGPNFLKKATCNGIIQGVPPQAGTYTPNNVECTAEGNTKTIFVMD